MVFKFGLKSYPHTNCPDTQRTPECTWRQVIHHVIVSWNYWVTHVFYILHKIKLCWSHFVVYSCHMNKKIFSVSNGYVHFCCILSQCKSLKHCRCVCVVIFHPGQGGGASWEFWPFGADGWPGPGTQPRQRGLQDLLPGAAARGGRPAQRVSALLLQVSNKSNRDGEKGSSA